MAKKILDAHIQLKYDTLANWTTSDHILLSGEVAICTVPTGATTDGSVHPPAVLFKVGDGTHKFSELPWAQAKAADVYGWAKESKKPTYAATEITGLSDFISTEVQDTNTTYKLETDTNNPRRFTLYAKEIDGDWTARDAIEIPGYTLGEGAANGTVAFNGTDVKVHGLGSAAYKDETTFEKANAAAAVKTELEPTVKDTATKVGTLVGDDGNKSVRTIANEELAAQLIPENAKDSLDTLAEIAAWIQNHPDDASAMNQAITALQDRLSGIAETNGAVKTYIDDAISALNVGDYAKAADLMALVGRVVSLEGKSDEWDTKADGVHTHTIAEITSLQVALNNKLSEETDPTVPAWAKKAEKPTYTAAEVGAAETSHVHAINAIDGLQTALNGKQPAGDYLTKETDPTVPAWAKAENKPSYSAAEVGAAPASHTHTVSAVTGLQDALDGKQPVGSYLTAESDPTVPAWAKAANKPEYTAGEVGADERGSAMAVQESLETHKTDAAVHVSSAERTVWNGKATPSIALTATLVASAWVLRNDLIPDARAPEQGHISWWAQAVSVPGMTETSNAIVSLAQTAMPDEAAAAAAAGLLATKQEEGKLSLRAYGTLPTIDIPITIMLVG